MFYLIQIRECIDFEFCSSSSMYFCSCSGAIYQWYLLLGKETKYNSFMLLLIFSC